MEANLIPCPDCGAAAEVKQGSYPDLAQLYSYVHCTNPDCHLYRHTLRFTAATPMKSQLRAVQSWNERYADVQPMEARRLGDLSSRTQRPAPGLSTLHA